MSTWLSDVAQTALSAIRAAQESTNADDFVADVGRSFRTPGGRRGRSRLRHGNCYSLHTLVNQPTYHHSIMGRRPL